MYELAPDTGDHLKLILLWFDSTSIPIWYPMEGRRFPGAGKSGGGCTTTGAVSLGTWVTTGAGVAAGAVSLLGTWVITGAGVAAGAGAASLLGTWVITGAGAGVGVVVLGAGVGVGAGGGVVALGAGAGAGAGAGGGAAATSNSGVVSAVDNAMTGGSGSSITRLSAIPPCSMRKEAAAENAALPS